MPLLRCGIKAIDEWIALDDGSERPTCGDIIVPLQRWLDERDVLLAHHGRIGVALTGDDSIEAVGDELAGIGLIALDFASFVDGRHYSNAAMLRERYRFDGEIRARGDIGCDQAFFLARIGCNAILVPDTEDIETFRRALSDFSVVYQYGHDPRTPAYRLRSGHH